MEGVVATGEGEVDGEEKAVDEKAGEEAAADVDGDKMED
jgi:hypothetical protein